MSSVQYYLDPLNGQCKVPAVEISKEVCEFNQRKSQEGLSKYLGLLKRFDP